MTNWAVSYKSHPSINISVTVSHRFGSVSADGQYSSPIQSKGSRFNAMLAALTPTRLALTVQAMAAMKVRASTVLLLCEAFTFFFILIKCADCLCLTTRG